MSVQKQVEVDQAERDRHIQEKQQKLQDHIQAVGVGIAGGAIAISSLVAYFAFKAAKYGIEKGRSH